MAALPPFLGFVAKEADFETLAHSASLGAWAPVVLAGVVIGSVFTTIYSLRFLWGAFARKGFRGPSIRVANLHRPPATFLVAPAHPGRGGSGVRSGARPVSTTALDDYADTLSRGGLRDGYYTWRSGTASTCRCCCRSSVLVVGTAAFFGRRPADAGPGLHFAAAGQRRPDLRRRHPRRRLASRAVTAITQRGSIPATQSVILVDAGAAPDHGAGARGARPPATSALWDSPVQPVVGLLILAAAMAATVMRNRLAAVLLVGVTGYGCGVIFAFHGAPDLALTQFLVETLTLVIFVLVLRTLPAEAERRNVKRFRLPARCSALAVGATVTTLAVFAMAARTTRPIADLLPDAAYYRGHGSNTVNVLLVDIRAWDTLGEISVLLVAATGVASLVFRHRRFGSAPRVPQDSRRRPARHRAGARFPTARRSATRPGCAAANSATRATGPWCSRSRRE